MSKCLFKSICCFILLVVQVGLLVQRQPTGINARSNHLRLSSVPVKAPHRFTDAILPDSQRTGQEVENLGQVMLLKTILPHKSTNTMLTKFNIFNRRKSMRGIKFGPKVTCTLGEFNRTHGPYEYNLDLILQSSFNIESKTIVMVPGYLSEREEPWIKEARESWLDMEDVNVIDVSWSDSNHGMYSTAVAHTPLVARQITIFLYYLAELSGKRLHDDDFLDKIHLIGHSLGAHIVGFVGQDLDGRAGRITGLDPAGPSFDKFPSNQRLDRHDAKLVEILHTNRGTMKYANAAVSAPLHAMSMLPGMSTMVKALSQSYSGEGDTAWYGIDMNSGHIDYHANNGRVQPGCSGLLHICDHNRATDIYVEMLRYERQLRLFTNDKEVLRQSRLLAFRAYDYTHFITGESFTDRCSPINMIETHLGLEVNQTIQRCTIPIDLVSPASELMEELQRDYGIDFSYSSPTSAETFYFKTLDDGNLVGDHYLLKIYVKVRGPNNRCALKVNIEMPRGEVVELELDRVAEIHDTDDLPLAIPFVHPGGATARDKLARILKILNEEQTTAQQEQQQTNSSSSRVVVEATTAPPTTTLISDDRIRDLLPKNISIVVSRPKSRSVFGTVKDLTIKMLKLDAAQACNFDVNLIEVHPIVGAERNFAGLYYNNPNEGTASGDGERNQLRSFTIDEMIQFREENFIGRLEQEGSILKVSLNGVAFG